MNFKIYSRMKPISALTLGFFGLVTSVFAVSSEQTNGKLTLGDPIPEVTAQDQDGQTVNLAQAGKTGFTLSLSFDGDHGWPIGQDDRG